MDINKRFKLTVKVNGNKSFERFSDNANDIIDRSHGLCELAFYAGHKLELILEDTLMIK